MAELSRQIYIIAFDANLDRLRIHYYFFNKYFRVQLNTLLGLLLLRSKPVSILAVSQHMSLVTLDP